MKLRRDDFTGIGQVYRFTLLQMLKGKANWITTLLLLIFSMVSVPVTTLMMGGERVETSGVTAVYVQNESGYELDLADVQKNDPFFADTLFSATDLTESTYGEKITSSEAYVHIIRDFQTNTFKLTGFMREDAVFPREELTACTDTLSRLLDEARIQKQNVAPEQMDILMSDFETQVESVEEFQNTEEDDFDTRFGVQLLYCILVLMLCTFVATYIVQIVVQEKASKLSEFLMVSIRPLAMLLGKILAMMTYVFGMLLLCVLAFVVSYGITGLFADTSVLSSTFSGMGITADSFRLSWDAAVIVLVSLLLAYLTVSLLAGLIGAGCSAMEDAESANLAVMLTVLAGYLVSVSLTPAKGTVPVLLSTLIPVVSMFAAPVRYLLGDIGIGPVLLSWLIQLLVIALIAYMSAKVYRDLLLYRGGRLKFGGYISMLRQNKMGRGQNSNYGWSGANDGRSGADYSQNSADHSQNSAGRGRNRREAQK